MKKHYVLFFIFIFNYEYAQSREIIKIDSLLYKADQNLYINTFNTLKFAKNASLIAENIDEPEKKAWSYLYIAKSLAYYMRCEESIQYINKGLSECHKIKDNKLILGLLAEVLSVNYSRLGFLDQQLGQYQRILTISSDQNSISFKLLRSRTYRRLSLYYTNIKKYELAENFINKALVAANYPEIGKKKLKRFELDKANIYNWKGVLCLKQNEMDSSYYYLNKAILQARIDRMSSEYWFLANLGRYYKENKNYQKSLKSFLHSLEIAKNSPDRRNNKNYSEEYQEIASLYKILNNREKESFYNKLAIDAKGRENEERMGQVQKSISSILNEQQNEKQSIFGYLSLVIVIIIIVALMLIYFMNSRYKLIKRKKAILREKYDKVISELIDSKKKNNIGLNNFTSESESSLSVIADNRLMSLDKEKEILRKLEVFERGLDFTIKGFTISNLSSILETNTKYLTYILKERRNKNFNDYINGLRIKFIVEKLYEDPKYLNYKINYLSELSGFSTHSRFAQIFKKEVDMSPSEFICQINKNKNN